jgi:hypothetical protein
MNHRCANPRCDSEFDYFRPLRLRAIPLRSSRATMLLWLCDDCCSEMKVDKKGLPRLQSRKTPVRNQSHSLGG